MLTRAEWGGETIRCSSRSECEVKQRGELSRSCRGQGRCFLSFLRSRDCEVEAMMLRSTVGIGTKAHSVVQGTPGIFLVQWKV
jgi:hypothetical protein